MKKNILWAFLDKVFTFPLWVKQVIYLRLYQDLSKYLSEDFITVHEENIFSMHVPQLSFLGETELNERSCGLDSNIYNFLENVKSGLSVLEISMNNFWTMEETSKYFILCLEQNYIKNPESKSVGAMAGFMAGKLRTGEYFKSSGKININQLDRVIEKQDQMSAEGNHIKIAQVMILMGLISEKDTASLFAIQEESKKRFILDASIVPAEALNKPLQGQNYEEEIAKLKEQNTLLKTQLAKVLAFVKKNG